MTAGTLLTADELLERPDDGWRYELVAGELRRMSPAGFDHGVVTMRLMGFLSVFVFTHHLGVTCSSETGFRIRRNPDTVLAPDGAFVGTDRLIRTPKFFEGAPDLAIEVVSPSDRYSEVEEKTRLWLQAGSRAVIIVDPETKTVRIHRPSGSESVRDTLALPDILPGWSLGLTDLFA